MNDRPDFKWPDIKAEDIAAEEIAKIDSEIQKANAHFYNKHHPERPPVLLYWTPCSGSNHGKSLSYFLVWACDERKFTYEYKGKVPAYFYFKGMLSHWKSLVERDGLDSIEQYVLEEEKHEDK